MNKLALILIFISLFISCTQNSARFEKSILVATREAPLGWLTLYLYEDKKFEFKDSGLRSIEYHSGNFTIEDDKLIINYTDSAFIDNCFEAVFKNEILYFDCPIGGLQITKNELNK